MQTWYEFLLLVLTVSTITPYSNKDKKMFHFFTSTVKGLLENSFTKRFAIVQLKYTHNFQGTVNKRRTFKSLANGFEFRGLDPRPQYSASLLVHTWLICITIICKQIMREAKKEKVKLPFVLSLNQREGNDCFAAWSLSFSTGDPVYLDHMTWKGIHRWSDQSSSCVDLLFQPHVARLCKKKVLQFVVVRLLHTEPELIRPVHLWYFNSCSIDRCFYKNQPSQWSSR